MNPKHKKAKLKENNDKKTVLPEEKLDQELEKIDGGQYDIIPIGGTA